MIKLLKSNYISQELKNKGKRKIVNFDKNIKKDDYVFCDVSDDMIKVISWCLYKDVSGNNAYEEFKKYKEDSCNYGLKVDKLTNIFNDREERINKDIDNKILQNIHNNIDECLKEDRNLYKNIDFNIKVLDKLIVGLGGYSVFQTDIKLHHTYGIPYIPASSVKGCFRSHIIQKYFKGKETLAENDKNFIEIFGGIYLNKTYAGNVVFMDVFPKNSFNIKKDVMTPHYQSGYTDDGIITPIQFLTVENTCFRFLLRINDRCLLEDKNSEIKLGEKQDVVDFIAEEFLEMLATHGIGAKTSVGYGYFEEVTKEECLQQVKDNNEKIEKGILEEKEKQKLNKMNESERKLYKVKKIFDIAKRKEAIKNLFANRDKENLKEPEIIELAKLVKEDLKECGKWEYDPLKAKKKKNMIRTKEICETLNIDLP